MKKADILIKQARKIKEVEIVYDPEGKRKSLPMEQSGLNEIKVDKLLNAARILLDAGSDAKRIVKLINQVLTIDGRANYRKYGFPEFKNSEAIEKYLVEQST